MARLPSPASSSHSSLTAGLNGRQITMLSIGGVIGAGLFVGSSEAIAQAGPGVLVSFLMASTIVVLVMRMLGEMAIANPDSGSFSTYADRALGHWAGFSIGWLYWWFYVLVIPIEGIAVGKVLGPSASLPSWIPAFVVIAALAGTNLLAVRNYGKFEYWFALLKVIAIISFISIGVAAICGLLPNSHTSGIANLWQNGGFLPQGGVAIMAGLLTAMFAFQGSEIVTIAAAESDAPKRNIRKAIRAVVWRLALFYLGSIFITVSLVPWNAPELENGSYQAALELMNVPGAATIMDIVLVIAVCSCLNSAIYTSSRMLFSLSTRGDAPKFAKTIADNSTPRNAVLASTMIGVVAVVVNYAIPAVFTYLMASSGAIALLMYLVIAITQYAHRRSLRADGAEANLQAPMWGFPYLTLITIAGIAAVLITMAILPGKRLELWLSLSLAAILAVAGAMIQRRHSHSSTTSTPSSGTHEGPAAASSSSTRRPSPQPGSRPGGF